MKHGKVFALIAAFFSAGLAQASTVECEHFWIQHLSSGSTILIPSNNVVGIDPGPSPYGVDGVYHCKAHVSSNEDVQDAYLYIGEVGDASAISFEKKFGNGTYLQISHGLDLNGKTPDSYLRFVPFIVPVSRFFKEPVTYNFSVYYKDIVPGQTGIRSGPPDILSGTKLAKRVLNDFKGELYYLLQVLISISLLPLIFLSRKLSPARVTAITALSLLTASLFFSFSAIPRNLLNPIFAMRFHDVLLLIVTAIGNYSILLFYRIRSSKKAKQHIFLFSGSLAALISMSCMPNFPIEGLIKVQAIAMFIGGALLPIYIAFQIIKGNIASRVDIDLKNYPVVSFLLIKAFIMCWDAADLGIFDGRFPFYTGKFYFLPSLLILGYLEFKNAQSELQFRRNLSTTRSDLMKILSSDSVEDSLVLTSFAEHLGKLCHSTKVSISEVLAEKKIRLVGKFGNYPEAECVLALDERSPSYEVVKDLEIKMASLPRLMPHGQMSNELSDYIIVPLRNAEDFPGLLCMTNFDQGIFSPFISERIHLLQSECEVLFHLMRSKRDNKAKAHLLQTTRLKVHPIQLESETWFLEKFQISERLAEPAFIYGDVVDSVSINELFGGESLRKVIDAHLAEIFLRNKDTGVILSRDRGDSVSLIIPNQSEDSTENNAAERAFKILCSIRDLSDRLAEVSKANGIPIPLRYRFVLSAGKIALRENQGNNKNVGLTSFSLLADSAIDEAARIISHICLPGEYLITDSAVKKIMSSNLEVIELPSSRLKGKTNSTQVYCLAKNKFIKKAA